MKKKMVLKDLNQGERELLYKIDQRGLFVFSVAEAVSIAGGKRRGTVNCLSALSLKGHLIRLKVGLYTLPSFLLKATPYEIGCAICKPSYISLSSCLYLKGFLEEPPDTIHLMVKDNMPSFELAGARYSLIKARKFFGFEEKGNLVIATTEKAFIDCLMHPTYIGGISSVISAMEKGPYNEKRLVEMTLKMENRCLNSRVGYLLERMGHNTYIDRLENKVSQVYIPLDRSLPWKGKNIRKWHLRDNVR